METPSLFAQLSQAFRITALLMPVLLLSHCATHSPEPGTVSSYMPPAPATSAPVEDRSVAKSRPGLGTQLGHELRDSTKAAAFYRQSSGVPDAVGTFHYNDEEGARLMAGLQGHPVRRSGAFDLIPGKLRVSVTDGFWNSSKALDHYEAGQGFYVVGTPGKSYALKLENRTNRRMEVVMSVDGLDLLDGQPASVKKPGYLIPAKSSVLVQGMRVGGKLYSLKFGTVSQARAATAFGQKGARNVGVVGMACYEEDEAARRRVRVEETYVREGARAFGS